MKKLLIALTAGLLSISAVSAFAKDKYCPQTIGSVVVKHWEGSPPLCTVKTVINVGDFKLSDINPIKCQSSYGSATFTKAYGQAGGIACFYKIQLIDKTYTIREFNNLEVNLMPDRNVSNDWTRKGSIVQCSSTNAHNCPYKTTK